MMQIVKSQVLDKKAAGLRNGSKPKFILRLFISGVLQNSICAVTNIQKICEEYLEDNYELDVIDIYQQPDLAIREQIIVIPVLIIKYPLPERRLIGDLSNIDKVLEILNSK